MRRLMRSPIALRVLAAFALLAALLAPVARAGGRWKPKAGPASAPAAAAARPAVAGASCEQLLGIPIELPPVLRSSVGLNYPNELPESPATDGVLVCVLVDSTGVVREARLLPPAGPLDLPALDSARWWVFEPARLKGRAVPSRIIVKVGTSAPRDAEALVPDVVALARDAEVRGNLREAIDAWTGALARTGIHSTLQNEWALREQVLRVAANMGPALVVPDQAVSHARGTRQLMLRHTGRADNADYALALDKVLSSAPWYGEAYRWRASARASCGQRDGAVRDVLCFRLAVRDSASQALAERALVALANADTVAALTMLKN